MAQIKKKEGKEQRHEGTNRIVVSGEMTGPSVFELEPRLIDNLASSAPGPVTLDLKTVERIDSSGIALCIGFVKECALLKKPCVIEASEELHKLFNVMKLNLFFDLREVTAQ